MVALEIFLFRIGQQRYDLDFENSFRTTLGVQKPGPGPNPVEPMRTQNSTSATARWYNVERHHRHRCGEKEVITGPQPIAILVVGGATHEPLTITSIPQ